jgi:hypothetical protein
MTKLTVKKQSLIDWTVEDESHKALAWIEHKKDTAGKTFWFYEVRYSKNLGIGAEKLSHDFALSFKDAKQLAFDTINNWNKA